jgi:hypothetical protein
VLSDGEVQLLRDFLSSSGLCPMPLELRDSLRCKVQSPPAPRESLDFHFRLLRSCHHDTTSLGQLRQQRQLEQSLEQFKPQTSLDTSAPCRVTPSMAWSPGWSFPGRPCTGSSPVVTQPPRSVPSLRLIAETIGRETRPLFVVAADLAM